MLKRKRSLLAGGLTSSCRIKAEALARAFNSRIWPCSWRATPVRRQDDDEEFYEASPIEDDDWGGRGPDRSAATEEGRAKLYELLQQHAVDDATDVFYDVSEHAIDETEGGKVSERFKVDGSLVHDVIMHEPCETSNGIWVNGESSSDCSNLGNGNEASNGAKADSSSVEVLTDDCCQNSSDTNDDKQSPIECSSHDDCQASNGVKSYEQSSIECSNCEDCSETSKENAPLCIVDKQSSNESSKYEDSHEFSNCTNGVEQSPPESSKCDNQSERSNNGDSCGNNEFVNSLCESGFTQNKHIDDCLINCGSSETEILNRSMECLSTQEYPSILDSGNVIANATESVNVTPLLECLNSPDSLDLSVNFDSDYYAKSESTDTESTSLTNSFECSHKNSENVLLNTIEHNKGIQNFETNGTNEVNVPMSDDTVSDICTDFSNYLNKDSINELPNQLNKSECLSNSSIEHLNSSNSQIDDHFNHSISSTMNIADVDNCHFDKEEILTVIIDSNLFNIQQTEDYNFESELLSSDHCVNLLNDIPPPPEFSITTKDAEALNVFASSQLIEDINDKNSITFQNDCDKMSTLKGQENISDPMSNNDQETLVSMNELDYQAVPKEANEDSPHSDCASLGNISASENNNVKEEIIPPNEMEYPVSIKVTNDANSPTHASSKDTGFENLEAISTDEDSRLKVFDEHRPMISRSTSLKTGKTPPGTPSRKKIVRFADVLGLDLEDVRHIISGDLPNIPSSAYSDLALGSDPFPATVAQSVTVELNCRQQASWESVPGLAGPNALYPLFAIPGQQPDFMERVRTSGVCLESIVIEECNVQCTCRVMNWGYNKKVVARYTTNGWSTSCDINASYVSDSTRDGTDSFAFNIFLSRDRSDLQFALRYEINGNEYWDNNGGKNYCFSYHSINATNQTTEACSPTWMGQFW